MEISNLKECWANIKTRGKKSIRVSQYQGADPVAFWLKFQNHMNCVFLANFFHLNMSSKLFLPTNKVMACSIYAYHPM